MTTRAGSVVTVLSACAWAFASAALAAPHADAGSAAKASPQDGCMIPGEFKTLWPPVEEVVFQPTTLEERETFEAIVPELLSAAKKANTPPRAIVDRLAKVGFTLDVWHVGTETFWAVRERAESRRGAGAYVFRTGEAADVVLQAPHVYFDLGTETIGAALFTCAPQGFKPRVFITNTAHRYKGRTGERRDDPDHPADVAHNPDHLFQVVTNSVVRVIPDARVVQLHGFGPGETKRNDLAAVVSAGTREPGSFIRRVAVRLSDVLGDGIRLYPDETDSLGGTQNAQGRLLQAYPKARFVHLELSSELRKALKSSNRLADVAKALFAPEEE